MLDDLIKFFLRRASLHVGFDANIAETYYFLGSKVSSPPHCGDIDVPLQFEFQLVEIDSLHDAVGMNTDRNTGTEGRKSSFRGIWSRVIPEKARRLIDDVSVKIADVIFVPEFIGLHRLAFQCPNGSGVLFSLF